MALLSDEYQTSDELTFKYTHPSFGPGEHLIFRAIKSDMDAQKVTSLLSDLKKDERSSYERMWGTIVVMCNACTLKLPKGFRQPVRNEDGEVVTDDKGTPKTEAHPLAGKVFPMTYDYARMLPEAVSTDIIKTMGEKYSDALSSKEGVKSLPSESPRASPPEDA